MNPYFNSSFTFQDTRMTPYGYGQVTPSAQLRQTYTPQPLNSIDSMYTSVQPYYNKDFLLTTFGNKQEYIQIFLTLSHEDKLKLYLLMQQKKIYGEITDKEAYQKILKEIAQKLQNYNAFHQTKPNNLQNSEQKKKKQLQNKIDSFCEKSFQKLNLSKLGNQKKSETITAHYQDIEELDQWIESTIQQGQAPKPVENIAPEYNAFENQFFESNKQNLAKTQYEYTQPAPQQQQQPVVFSMFNFDTNMERAMTKQIGLKDTQKLSIWEMELSQPELKNNELSLHEVFKKKEPLHESIIKKPQSAKNLDQNHVRKNSFDIFASQTAANNLGLSGNNSDFGFKFIQQQTSFNDQIVQNTFNVSSITFDASINFNNNPYPADTNSHVPNVQSNIQIPIQMDGEDQQQQEWNEGFQQGNMVEQPTHNQNHPEAIKNNLSQYQKAEILAPPQQQQIFDFQLQSNDVSAFPTSQSSHLSENLFDFDVFDNKVAIETPYINQENADLFLSSRGQSKQQTLATDIQDINDDFHIIVPDIPQEIIQTVVDLDVEPNSLINTQLYLPDNQKKYEIIDNLKVQFSQSDKIFIKKQLRHKSFECNAQFYLTIINHLRSANLESSPEYQHFSDQYKIAKEMHELTIKYTSVVDEQDEEKVERALRQSKALYNKIYNKSTITEKYVEHLLSDKNKQKGLCYKLGKILIDSCINTDLITRASAQQRQQNIFNSFCMLFILQKNNTLNKLKNYAQLFINFANQEIERCKSFNDQIFKEIEDNVNTYPAIQVYIKGLLKITCLCERMILLMKVCTIKTNSNLVKTLKNCKEIKNRFNRFTQTQNNTLYPHDYGKVLKYCVQKNYSLYDLHGKISQAVQKLPVCQLCLLQIGNLGDHVEDKGWYHYSCFNLMKSIQGLDYI